MTKTQALQRLFTALTDVPISEVANPTNTSTKMVELLAMAAENGEIGGGGDYDIFHVTVTDENGGGHTYFIPNIVTEDGTSSLMGFHIPSSEPETIDVVGYGEGAIGWVNLTGFEVTGDIQKNESSGVNTIFMISGDGTITFSDK